MILLLGAAWSAAVLGLAWSRRPPPRRLRALARPTPHSDGPRPGRLAITERIGGWALARAGRPVTSDASLRLGRALLVAGGFLPVLPAAAVPAALVTWALPGAALRRVERRRLAALASDLPDVVDLLVLAVGAGLTVHLAVVRVTARASGPLAEELRLTLREVAHGRRLSDALDDLPLRTGEAVRPLVAALVASERYGAPLMAGLERLSDEVRRDRRRRAEEAARKVPVKLLFPLVTCTLPAFGLLTVAPLVASAVRSLRL
ncbi:MAG: type II secretion system F family protein [Actinobacteria bacterium]|nr:type II secretion system F family protein [Actinomycetota bacterium]